MRRSLRLGCAALLLFTATGAGPLPTTEPGWQGVSVSGYGVRAAVLDAEGGLALAPAQTKTKGKVQAKAKAKAETTAEPVRMVLPESHAHAMLQALAEAGVDALPAAPPAEELPNMVKLSEPYALSITWPDKTLRFAFDATDLHGSGPMRAIATALMPVIHAIRDAQRYLDMPPLRLARGRFEVGIQAGRVGVHVDAWNLYRPLAEDPRNPQLVPLLGQRVGMEVALDRDHPDVFVLRKLIGPLPAAACAR